MTTPPMDDAEAREKAAEAVRDYDCCGCAGKPGTVFCDDPSLPEPDPKCYCKLAAKAAIDAYIAARSISEATDAETREKAAKLIAEWACINYDDLPDSRASERPSGPYPQWHATAFSGRHFQGGTLDLLDLVDKIAGALPRCSCAALVEALEKIARGREIQRDGHTEIEDVEDAAEIARTALATQREKEE